MPKGIYHHKTGHRKVVYIQLNCEVCHKPMEFSPGVIRQRKVIRFCSRSCMGIANQKLGTLIECVCSVCEVTFTKRRDHIQPKNFCSRKCSGLARQKPNPKWNDPAYVKAYRAVYNEVNKERLAANKKAWFAVNKDKKAAVQRARRFGVTSSAFSARDWQLMKWLHEYKCLKCHLSEPEIVLTQDHIVARHNGGTHAEHNIQPLCFACNRKKSTPTADYRPPQKKLLKAVHGIEITEV